MTKSITVCVPDLDGEMGRVVWAKHEGDAVEEGEAIVDIDLGYARTTVTAPCTGLLVKVLAPEGQEARAKTALGLCEGVELASTSKPVEICSSCGVLRVDRTAKCGHCHAPHTSVARTTTPTTDAMWVNLECTFRCRACGFVVPQNELDLDGAVHCGRCGSEQAFEIRAWHDAFDLAHAVADGSIHPAQNQIAVKQAFPMDIVFEVNASPGHPLCEACHALLAVAFDEREASPLATVSCDTCRTSASYAVPNAAAKMTKGALRGVIAAAHRSDHAAVRVEQTPAAIAVHCPSCNAPLDAGSDSKIVKCKFCNTTSRIPDATWFRMSGKAPEVESMWLAFRGPSHARREAAGLRAKKKHDEELHRLREARQAAALQAREQAAVAERNAAYRAQQAAAAVPGPTASPINGAGSPAKASSKVAWVVAAFVGAILGLAGAAYAYLQVR